MYRTLLLCLAVLPGATLAATVTPATDTVMGCALSVSGEIASGDTEALTEALDRLESGAAIPGPVGRRICLDSPGGSLVEAALLADLVAGRAWGTAVPDGARCESACAVVFMAGTNAPMESDGAAQPDRILHPRGRLGFHAPRLAVPEGQYSEAELNRAYGVALASIGEIVQLRSRHRLIWPDSLLLTLLATPSDQMATVDTVGQASRWQIEVAPVALPADNLDRALSNACLNADAGMLDFAPEEAWYNGKTLTFAFDGFGETSAELHSREGFRAEAVAPCALFLSQPQSPVERLGAVTLEGGLPTEPTWRGLYPYALYAPETPIAALPVTGDTPFFAGLSDMARQSLTTVTFDSCWMLSPEAKVVNVENYVNLRSEAGFDGQVLRELPLGERLRVLGTQTLLSIGDAQRASQCLEACNGLAMTPDDAGLRATVDGCIARNTFWYEVQDASGQRGYVSRKYLSD